MCVFTSYVTIKQTIGVAFPPPVSAPPVAGWRYRSQHTICSFKKTKQNTLPPNIHMKIIRDIH